MLILYVTYAKYNNNNNNNKKDCLTMFYKNIKNVVLCVLKHIVYTHTTLHSQ